MTDTVLISEATIKALGWLNQAQKAHDRRCAEVLRLNPLPRQYSGHGFGGYRTTYSDACDDRQRSGRAVERACDDLIQAAKANEAPHHEVRIPSGEMRDAVVAHSG